MIRLTPLLIFMILAKPNLCTAQRFDPNYVLPLGIGVASPNMVAGRPLYFYGAPDFNADPYLLKPIDSVTFVKGKHNTEIATAPPWLAPEHIKLDYGIFTFRVVTYSQNWIEVIVNNYTGQTSWVNSANVGYTDWGRFLASVVAVEVLDIKTNPLRIKPFDNASTLTQVQGAQLRPIAVQGDWLLISTAGLGDKLVPTGWIRWRKNNSLLIMYSLLS